MTFREEFRMKLTTLFAMIGMVGFGLTVHELFPPDLYLTKATQYSVMAFSLTFGLWWATTDNEF